MKKYFLLTSILFVHFFMYSQSPSIEWQKNHGGTQNEYGYSIKQTIDNGYILAGWISSIEEGVFDWDVGIVKLTSNGDTTWTKSYGGSAFDWVYDIQQTNDGGYIFAGSSQSIDGDVHTNYGGSDFWIVKLDNQGDTLWTKSYGGSGYESAWSIRQIDNVGYYVAGVTTSTDGFVHANHGSQDYWVLKLNLVGDTIWTKCLGGSNDEWSYSMDITTDGGCILSGDSNSNDGDINDHHGSLNTLDNWVVKLDSSGIIEWKKSYGGTSNDGGSSIKQTNDNGYVFAGISYSNDGYAHNNNGGADYWIVKLDAIGDTIWSRSFGGTGNDYPRSIQQLSNGSFIVAGESNSNNGFVHDNHGNFDYWLLELKSNGDTIWTKSLGGSANERAWSIQQTADSGYIVTGQSESIDGNISSNNGLYDFWTLKLTFNTVLVPTVTKQEILLYPNPSSEEVHIDGDFINEIKVVNYLGRVIYKNNCNCNKCVLDISNYRSGVYIVIITCDKSEVIKKIIKE